MIPVKVQNLTLSNVGFVVLLKGVSDERTLPIYIGPPEAQSILLHLNEVGVPRPLTHDLFRNVLGSVGVSLDKVTVCDLRDETFFATLTLTRGDQVLEIDSRPSDSIALALRCDAPIFVAESVMEKAGVVLDAQSLKRRKVGPAEEESPEPEEKLSPFEARLALLRSRLREAVEAERYEEAATLRDEIAEMTGSSRRS